MLLASRRFFFLLAGCCGLLAACSGDTAPQAADAPAPTASAPGGQVNSPPQIVGTPVTTATPGTPYSFQPTASDANNDPLTFGIDNRPPWATFSTTTGELTGTPTAGTFNNIVVSVSDGQHDVQLTPFSIIVQAASGTNSAPAISGAPPTTPTISGTPATSVLQGTQYSFTPGANDANGDVLTFSIANKPSWASFTTSTGRVQGTPGPEHVGTTNGIVIAVTDGAASAALASFSVTVQAAATGSATLSWTPPTTNSDGSPLTNLAGYKVYWGTSQGNYPNSVTLNNAGLTSYVVGNLVPGTYFFVMTAVNGSSAESPRSNAASKTIP